MPSPTADPDRERLLRGIAASAFDTETADAPAVLASLVTGLSPDDALRLIETERALLEPALRNRASDEDVAAFRALLAERGLDGFLVPVTDAYRGEFVPPCARRLRWLSGFSGSSGLGIVLAGRAAVFVDGRYELQAADEIDGAVFDVRHVTRSPPRDWLAENVEENARIGFDPWLHTPRELDALRSPGIKFAAVEANPLDLVWTSRPPEPIGPVTPHEIRYAGAEASEKRREIARKIAEAGWRAAVVCAPDSVAWLLNVRGSDVANTPLALSRALIRGDGGADWFVDRRKLTPAVRERLDPEVAIRDPESLGEALDALGANGVPIAFDPAATPAWIALRLERAGARTADAADPCAAAKARKNPVELDGARACHVRDGVALCEFLAWFEDGAGNGRLTETAAAARLKEFRRRDPLFRQESFETISAAGPNGAIVHYHASEKSDRPIRGGDVYLVDSGAQYLDGTTDVTRTVHVRGAGAPPEEVRDRFTRVLKGHIAIAAARFPAGTSGGRLDVLARAPLWQAGLDYDHGTGHGVGSYLGVHEGPQRISSRPDRVALEPGMILSNEPGYYRPGAYGIRIENLVAVRPWEDGEEDGRETLCFETLTLAPIDRALVLPDLLTLQERGWLDRYHDRVRETIGPGLSPGARRWLEEATAPI